MAVMNVFIYSTIVTLLFAKHKYPFIIFNPLQGFFRMDQWRSQFSCTLRSQLRCSGNIFVLLRNKSCKV